MHKDILAQPGAAAVRPSGGGGGRTTRQGNVVQFTCSDGDSMVVGQDCTCGGTIVVANPCPGKFRLAQDGTACVFTCDEAAKLTCQGCTTDCLNKADSVRLSDPAHARKLAAVLCDKNYGCGVSSADAPRCRSYGF